MNIFIITGSPNPEGNSSKLLDAFLSGIKECKTYQVDSYNYPVSPCADCGHCFKEISLCKIKDGMQDIYDRINWADVIVVATPIYYNAPPAPLKAIIDRTMCLYCRRFVHGIVPKKKKLGVMLISSGDDRIEAKESLKTQLKMLFDVMGASVYGTIFAGSCDNGCNMSDYQNTAKQLGITLYNEYKNQ